MLNSLVIQKMLQFLQIAIFQMQFLTVHEFLFAEIAVNWTN